MGSTVDLAYVDQSRDVLDADQTVYEAITDGNEIIDLGGERSTAGPTWPVQLQGIGPAEKGRRSVRWRTQPVHLAKVLKHGGNVLLLDEPTNDLDVDTLRRWKTAWSGSPVAPW